MPGVQRAIYFQETLMSSTMCRQGFRNTFEGLSGVYNDRTVIYEIVINYCIDRNF